MFGTRLSGMPMIMVYPKRSTQDQIAFIKSYLLKEVMHDEYSRAVDDFEAALLSDRFKDADKGYPAFIDVDSFVDYFLLSEVTKNPDSYRGSAFFHKVLSLKTDSKMMQDAQGPIVMGPVWDYNEAYGICCGFPIEGFQVSQLPIEIEEEAA